MIVVLIQICKIEGFHGGFVRNFIVIVLINLCEKSLFLKVALPLPRLIWHFSTNTSIMYCIVSSTSRRWHEFRQHLRLWRPLPISVGLVLLAVLQWRYIRQKGYSTDSKTVVIAKDWEVSKFTFLIDNCISEL